MPKDDWTPADLKTHRDWRKRMYAQVVAPVILEPVTVVSEPEPPSLVQRIEELEDMVRSLRGQFVRARIERSLAQEESNAPPPIKLDHVIQTVAKFYGLTMTEIRSARRMMKVVRPRQVAMYLCRELTMRSTPEIGRHLGGKDHTTVIGGCKKIESLMLSDEDFCQEVAELEGLFS
jgi:chromosomal replication initiation ATPase DnaA